MEELAQGFITALKLIFTLNPEVIDITVRTMIISGISTLLAFAICLPLGGLIYFYQFPGKRLVINIIQTLFSLPTVFVGLLVFIVFSKSGPLGGLGILFTPLAMVVGQVILISPVMTGLSISALTGVGREVRETAISLGASRGQTVMTILREARYAAIVAVLMGFGRAISEVGSATIVGGNIKGFTRVLTTALSLETQMGNIELALALGIILISVALMVNILLNTFQQR